MSIGGMSAADLAIAVERERCRRSLARFIRDAWPIVEQSPYNHNWHIDAVCAHLEAVSRGEIRKLIINVPPGSMKSLSVCVFWSAWQWLQNPGTAQLYTSFDAGLTIRDARKVMDILNSEWFLKRWGNQIRLLAGASAGEFDLFNARGVKSGGWRFATSVEGKTTGRHPDIKVIDDPTKPKEATKENLEKVKQWWQNTMRSRARDPAKVSTVLIMQRLDEDDLAGYFLARESDWTHVRIPLEFEPARPFETRWGRDPRTVEGESFWPSRFTPEVVESIKADVVDPGIYSAQYQQDPIPPGGTLFQAEWLRHTYDVAPTRGLIIQSWDMSFKGEDGSDYVVGQVWLMDGARFYLLDQVRKRLDFTGACEAVKDLRAKWPRTTAILIEDKANGPAIINHLSKIVPGLIPISVRDSKLARARAVAPLFRAGNVLLPESAPWLLDYRAELLKFPRGKNDDQVDTTAQALAYLADPEQSHLADFNAAMNNARRLLGG